MTQTPPEDGELDSLLAYIHERRNFDFRGYKRASLSRRIMKRMQAVGAEDYQRYMDVLEANPGEFVELFNTILINVTAFRRDPEAWDALEGTVLPELARSKGDSSPIRIWSAGCASGEEAYSLAVVLAETIGEDRFRRQVKIYATDADSEALAEARRGRYPQAALVEAFGEQGARRFFELDQGYGVFRADLRRSLIFGRHDLVQDPPISRIDLLACRNTLMYFTAEVQRQVLASFHFALNQNGILFLGKSEALVARTNLFRGVDVRRHIFRKDGERSATPPAPSWSPPNSQPEPMSTRLFQGIVEESPVAQLVVDAGGIVVLANALARRIFSIGSSGIGCPVGDGNLSLPYEEFRSYIQQVATEHRAVTLTDINRFGAPNGPASFHIVLLPLDEHPGSGLPLVAVTMVDVTRYRTLREDLERSRQELESAYEELQSTVEELETTNEELQSTNEELETTNEELHSTNEELETMNEELQSTNEELETINNELRLRTVEVDELNTFLESILASMRSAVVVLGTDMEVRAWNREAEDLWGLRSDEVHAQHFLNLDIGFPAETLGPAIRACLAGRSEGEQVTRPAVNRRGRAVDCTVTVSRLVADGVVRGVILLMDVVKREEDAARAGDG